MKRLLMMTAGLLLLPGLAYAQYGGDESDGERVETSDQGVVVQSESGRRPKNEPGGRRYNVQLNGGYGGYFGAVGNATNAGPSYGVTGAWNPTSTLAYELGYQGNSNRIQSSDARLRSNNVQVDAKYGPQLRAPVSWQPYVLGGVGVDFVQVTGTSPANLTGSTMALIPFGAGADFFTASPVRVGARAQYDFTVFGNAVSPGQAHPDGWMAGLTAQAAF